jgi:dTDP-4-amino-4,6-dideoxygalactose transaminase
MKPGTAARTALGAATIMTMRWHQYNVQVTAQARLDRDQLAKCLDAVGIDAVAYYPKLVVRESLEP